MSDPCNVLLQRKRQVLAKVETTCGTFETMTATDGKVRVLVGQAMNPEVPLYERDLASASLSRFDDIPGEQSATFSLSTEVVGSGTPATAPECDALLKGCGLVRAGLKKIAIGSITGGPYVRNETITGGTSSATGRLVAPSGMFSGYLYYEIVTGTFQSGEVITGGTSAATATSSGAPADAGYSYQPGSDAISTLSLTSEEDGYKKSIKGANGNMSMKWEVAKPGIFEFEFKGAVHSFGDGALTSSIDYYSTEPPVLKSAQAEFDDNVAGSYSPVISSIEISLDNTVTMRKDANQSNGFVSARITSRRPTLTLDPEMALAATYDFFAKLFAGTNCSFKFLAGSTAGNIIAVFLDSCQFRSLADADKDGVASISAELNINRNSDAGDDELEIIFV